MALNKLSEPSDHLQVARLAGRMQCRMVWRAFATYTGRTSPCRPCLFSRGVSAPLQDQSRRRPGQLITPAVVISNLTKDARLCVLTYSSAMPILAVKVPVFTLLVYSGTAIFDPTDRTLGFTRVHDAWDQIMV